MHAATAQRYNHRNPTLRIYEGASRHVTNLNGLYARRTGRKRIRGETLSQYAPVSSARRGVLMTKVENGEVDIANYTSARLGGVSKVITMKHLLKQYQLDAGAAVLRNSMQHIVASSATVKRRIQAILDIMTEIAPAAKDRLRATAAHKLVRETASGGCGLTDPLMDSS